MSKSKKELRRDAVSRERERRAESIEMECASNVDFVDWGTATILSESIRANILRLGGVPDSPDSRDPILVLSQQVKWPNRSFISSERRYRNYAAIELSDTQIQDLAWPWCRDFRFCKNGEFYPDWKTDFATTASNSEFTPIGSDEHHFYFISQNSSCRGDPLVHRVDHETMDEQPYNLDGASFGAFIELLIAT